MAVRMTIPRWLFDRWERHHDELSRPVRTFAFPYAGQVFEDRPYQLGIVNLSQDSHYRESVAAPARTTTCRRSMR